MRSVETLDRTRGRPLHRHQGDGPERRGRADRDAARRRRAAAQRLRAPRLAARALRRRRRRHDPRRVHARRARRDRADEPVPAHRAERAPGGRGPAERRGDPRRRRRRRGAGDVVQARAAERDRADDHRLRRAHRRRARPPQRRPRQRRPRRRRRSRQPRGRRSTSAPIEEELDEAHPELLSSMARDVSRAGRPSSTRSAARCCARRARHGIEAPTVARLVDAIAGELP